MERKAYHDYGNRVAIIGASSKRDRMSNKAVRAFAEEGFDVLPVHPGEDNVEGRRVYRELDEISGGVDIVSMYVSSERQGQGLGEEMCGVGIELVIFNPGTENGELEEELGVYGI